RTQYPAEATRRGAGAAASTIWGWDDLPEAGRGRPLREPQAGGTAVQLGNAADQAAPAQEDPAVRATATDPTRGAERSVVDGLRLRPGGGRSIDQVSGDRGRCHT